VTHRIRRHWPIGLLAVLILTVVAAPARSDQKSDIETIEKQIVELKKKLEEAKSKPASPSQAKPTPDQILAKVTWRNVGPANMGGRITALAVYEADPNIYYAATASGGLLKTTNNGITFEHQFDKQSTVSIGDVAVCQTNPNLVWVGTGEGNPRNSVSYGDGVYKSTDGGANWTNMGLKRSFSTGKILIDPKKPDTVYIGTLGRLYGPGGDRGVFKTEDGGKTWKQSLYIDDKTGIIDMVMDPTDPNVILAAAWERKRDEFDGFFGESPVPDSYGPIVTHGAGGGLYKTTDGGKNWKKINDPKTNNGNGLPTVKTGRMGLDYSRKTKGLIYAIIDTEKVGTGDPPRQVYMGIVGENAPDNGGAKLNEITPDAPAAKAGLKPGDIVVKADEKKVDKYDDLVEVIQTKKAGDKMKLVVKRDGKEIPIEVTMADRPLAQGGRGQGGGGGGRGQAPAAAARPIAGFQLAAGTTGVKIGRVTEGGPADKAGIKVDDEIVAVDGKAVKTPDEYIAAIGSDRKVGDKVKLSILRGTEKKEIEVVLAAPPGAAPAVARGLLMPGFAPDFTNREALKVGTVAKDGPAEKAGIKVGDTIIEIDGKAVENRRDFTAALRTGQNEDSPRKAGDKVKVKVKQGEKEIVAELALAEMQIPGFGGGGGGGGGGPQRGASSNKPNLLGLGGQQPNIQHSQGKDSFQTGGVFKSTDNGETWTRVNSLNPRPMYFSVVRVDPTDDKIVYVIGDVPVLWKSTNGGERFTTLNAPGVHADGHALWINPKNNKHLLIGCDGGYYVSFDAGAKWEHLNQQALGQFYHVAVDNRRPYKIYGGLQDNGSWGGPSQTLRSYGPINEDWIYVNGGDGFVCRVDPNDPDLVYAESQGGNITRRNFRTGERGFISPPTGQNEERQRFNWNTPFILSAHNSGIFYTASQFVWKSVKKGTTLKKISPEITRLKAGSATALSESPRNQDVVWAGTDDGFVWVTRDGGAKWTNVTENLHKAGVPGYRWIATLEASRDADGRCYVCLDAHRSDDDKPYLFVTEDFGATWKPIMAGLPAFGSTRVLREDIVNNNVLYCGTEFGAYVSLDKGKTWSKLGGNLPTVAVHEFAQPTTASEVVIGTHGRSVWIADVQAIRQLNEKTLTAKATLFAPAPAVRWRSGSGAQSPYSASDKKFVGTNPLTGGRIEYLLTAPAKSMSLRVYDVTGKSVASFPQAPRTPGLHTVNWSLAGQTGAVRPGNYRVTLVVDDVEQSQAIQVELDPNAPKDVAVVDGEELEPERPAKEKKNPAIVDD
jgi:S1-C subfamily serine protease/photosystem II stability/assembly factor-like uncharacterized protein